MWPFKNKQRPADDVGVELERARTEALQALDRSLDAAQRAEEALARGAPIDCLEIKEARTAIREASAAVRAWVKAGGA